MSAFILARERDANKIAAFQAQLGADLLARLQKEGIVKTVSEAVIRSGLPHTDFGLTNETWVTASLSTNAYNVYVNNALGQRQYAAFYGAANISDNPGISAVKLQVGSSGANTLDVIPVEDMYVELVTSGYFQTPVLYKPGETVYIQVYGTIAQTERFVLRSYIAEPSGQNMAPRLETRIV